MANLMDWKKSTPITKATSKKNPLLSLQSEFDNAMNRAMRDFYGLLDLPTALHTFENLMITPSIDIVEDKDRIKIEAEMPGMGEEDIKLSFSDGNLTISGEKSTSKKDENKNYVSREINYGRYERSIALPDNIDIDKAKATFRKGMLWVDIPKKAEASQKSRELKIEKA